MSNAGELKIGNRVIVRGTGAVHTAGLATYASGTVQYCVSGGICTVVLSNVTTTLGTDAWRTISTTIPREKLGVLGYTASLNQIRVSNKALQIYKSNGNPVYGFIVYPVADDYVES